MSARGTPPIEAYGAIGNLRSVALVGPDGAIDWCCWPRLDSPSLLGALLDRRRGGRFRVAPARATAASRRYLEGSNVLETRFEAGRAALRLVDFMPVRAGVPRLRPGANEIHRWLEAEGDAVAVRVDWAPRFDYARVATGIAWHGSAWRAVGGTAAATLAGLPADATVRLQSDASGARLVARFRVRPGAPVALRMAEGAALAPHSVAAAKRTLRGTLDAWRRWVATGHDSSWAGRHAMRVQRSALALKLLCTGERGAIAAAPTTSLPEAIGGERNWDYRYVWLRDAGMTVEALLGAGHPAEVAAFLGFIERSARRPNRHGPWLPLVFGVEGETELPEACLHHLSGYRASRPVRIGNGIAKHRGHDVYEQILGAALEYLALGHALSPAVRGFLARAADIAAREWRHPDHGIWEIPGGPRHFVHSKWTICTALDHALQLSREHGLRGDTARWAAERAACCDQVLSRGWDAKRKAFRMAYDLEPLDAANVLMPVLGFLPADDPRVAANLRRTLRELMVDDLCYRYRFDDGLRGEEGCFVACTFWVIEALVQAGQVARARRLFDRAARRASPLGLWAEQIDRRSGAHLGNFPQAFSHVAFHDAALRLAAAEGRRVPVPPDPAGVARHHARRRSTPSPRRRGGNA